LYPYYPTRPQILAARCRLGLKTESLHRSPWPVFLEGREGAPKTVEIEKSPESPDRPRPVQARHADPDPTDAASTQDSPEHTHGHNVMPIDGLFCGKKKKGGGAAEEKKKY